MQPLPGTMVGCAEAMVLAAGFGRRFGAQKLLQLYQGFPLLSWSIAAARAAPVRAVTVVVGPGGEGLVERGQGAQSAPAGVPNLRVVVAADAAEGMAASLRAGVEALPSDTTVLLLYLGDMPRIPRATGEVLLRAVCGGAQAAAPVHGGRRGHPVAFGAGLFPELALLQGDQGARAVLDRLGSGLALIDCADDGVLFDVDRPQDLA